MRDGEARAHRAASFRKRRLPELPYWFTRAVGVVRGRCAPGTWLATEAAMATHTLSHGIARRTHEHHVGADLARYAGPAGRALLSLIFLQAVLSHFSSATIGYAAQQGVPMAGFLVPLSGVMALVGGLSVLLGFHARIGAALLILFLIPVTMMMHQFWNVADPMRAQMERIMFMKNASILGGLLLLTHFVAGPVSLDARREQV